MATATISSGKTPTPRAGFLGGKQAQEWLAGIGFIIPAAIVVILFIFIPMLFAFYMSFTNWKGNQPPSEAQGIGLQNYAFLLTGSAAATDIDCPPGSADYATCKSKPIGGETFQQDFFKALKNTIYYAIGVVPTQTALALLLAVIVNQKFLKGRGLFRTAFYFPSITSSVVVGLIFLWLFNKLGLINIGLQSVSQFLGGGYDVHKNSVTWLDDFHGVIHNFLGIFGVNLKTIPSWLKDTNILGITAWNWISGPSVTMLAIMSIAIWTTSGTMMLIFLAALQDIPGQLYEAAAVDGATNWQRFWKITLPQLRPTTFFVVTIGLIGTFQVFDQIYVISSGDPAGTTSTIAWIVYRNALRDGAAGRGAATAFLLFVIILIFTAIQRRLLGGNSES